MASFLAFKGLFGWFLWPVCGLFCGLISDCLWHVQKVVLETVWIKKI